MLSQYYRWNHHGSGDAWKWLWSSFDVNGNLIRVRINWFGECLLVASWSAAEMRLNGCSNLLYPAKVLSSYGDECRHSAALLQRLPWVAWLWWVFFKPLLHMWWAFLVCSITLLQWWWYKNLFLAGLRNSQQLRCCYPSAYLYWSRRIVRFMYEITLWICIHICMDIYSIEPSKLHMSSIIR